MDDLTTIAKRAEPLVAGGACIRRFDGVWLSGIPYLWSAFSERAFVFRDEAQAREIQAKYNLNVEVICNGQTHPIPK
jgi:hypothetical protein